MTTLFRIMVLLVLCSPTCLEERKNTKVSIQQKIESACPAYASIVSVSFTTMKIFVDGKYIADNHILSYCLSKKVHDISFQSATKKATITVNPKAGYWNVITWFPHMRSPHIQYYEEQRRLDYFSCSQQKNHERCFPIEKGRQ